VRYRTGAPATSPGRWVLTVGASDNWATGQSSGAPDRSCSLSGAPSAPALNSARAVAHCSVADDRWRGIAVPPLAHRTVESTLRGGE
jgi:guanyl-specific ribonuclease Sa